MTDSLVQTSRHAVLDLVQLIGNLNLTVGHYRSYQKYLIKQINSIEHNGMLGQEAYLKMIEIQKDFNLDFDAEEKFKALENFIQKNNQLEAIREEILEVRRLYMSELQKGFQTDPKMWCACKHMFDAFILAEEVTNAKGNEDNSMLTSLEERTFRMMLKTLSLFLGYEPMDCESCLTDQILKTE